MSTYLVRRPWFLGSASRLPPCSACSISDCSSTTPKLRPRQSEFPIPHGLLELHMLFRRKTSSGDIVCAMPTPQDADLEEVFPSPSIFATAPWLFKGNIYKRIFSVSIFYIESGIQGKGKQALFFSFFFVYLTVPRGFEPLTFRLTAERATDCATGPFIV